MKGLVMVLLALKREINSLDEHNMNWKFIGQSLGFINNEIQMLLAFMSAFRKQFL